MNSNPSRSLWAITAISAIVVILLLAAIPTATRRESQSALAEADTATPRYPTEYPPQKQTAEIGRTQTVEAFLLTPEPTDYVDFPFATSPPESHIVPTPVGTPAGAGVIYEGAGDGGFHILYTNAWLERTSSGDLFVIAGGQESIDDCGGCTRDQGVVVVGERYGLYRNLYLSPTKHGALTIVGAQGERLILTAADGAVFYFDVPGRTFVSSLEEVVPTVTPRPTLTPRPTSTLAYQDDAPDDPYDVDSNSPVNTDLVYTVNPGDDLDWFRFHVDTPGAIQVDLANLAANFDLTVFSSTDPELRWYSKNDGLAAEQVFVPDAVVNDYYVRVIGRDGGAFSPTPYTLRFIVDRTPPTLALSAAPSELWPPNHRLVAVQVTVQATDDFDPNPVVQLVSVTSNEPDDGLGDGDTPGDIVIGTDGTIQLRAERSGSGSGRVYTITYSAADRAGNVTTQSVTVTAPHDQ